MKMRSVSGIVALMVLGAAAVMFVRSERPLEVYAATATYRLLPSALPASVAAVAHQLQEVSLVPEVPGRVLEVLVKEGEHVQQGQLLMRLDASSLHAELAQLKAAAEQAQSDIARNTADAEAARRKTTRFDMLASRRLIDTRVAEAADSAGARAREELGMSFAALDKANAGIVDAEKRLARARIVAPVSGKVTSIFVDPGATVAPGPGNRGALLAIAATGSIDSDISIRESDARRERARRVLVVPVEAVRYEGFASRTNAKRASVFVVDSGQARLRTVELGRADDRYVEIVRGLNEYDSVITGPPTTLRLLREDDRVMIVMPGAATPS